VSDRGLRVDKRAKPQTPRRPLRGRKMLATLSCEGGGTRGVRKITGENYQGGV